MSEGDALRFDVKDKTGVLSDCQVTMLYSEGSCVKFDLIEKGVVSCKIKSTQNDSNVMVVFDGDGKYVETDYFKNLTVQSSNLSRKLQDRAHGRKRDGFFGSKSRRF